MRSLFLAVVLLAGACSWAPAPLSLLASTSVGDPIDAGAPDGGAPDAAAPGCDPNAWATSCPAGQVCTSEGTCNGPACGNGNVVCDPSTVCSAQSDCVPPCRDASGTVIVLDPLLPGQTCASAGFLEPADATQQCLLPCWENQCTSTRRGYGGGC